MKRIILIAVLICFTITACASNKEENGKMTNQDTELEISSNNEQNNIENYHRLMEEDVTGDGMSVYWDGKAASVVEDQFDQNDIEDGRSVINGATSVKLPLLFEYSYPNHLEDVTVVSDNAENYHVKAKDYDIRFELVDYKNAVEELKQNNNLREIDKSNLSENQTKYFKDYHLYQGIINTQSGDYAGYVLVFESNLDDRQYKISCSGLGLIENIKITAFYIMNHFEVLFY